jgi:hypothetical protein
LTSLNIPFTALVPDEGVGFVMRAANLDRRDSLGRGKSAVSHGRPRGAAGQGGAGEWKASLSGLNSLRENYPLQIESRRSLCHSKVRRNRTGAPGSPKRAWAENDGE